MWNSQSFCQFGESVRVVNRCLQTTIKTSTTIFIVGEPPINNTVVTFRRSRTSTPNDVGDVYTPPKQRYKSSQDDITLRTRSTRISQRRAHSKQAFEEVAESPTPKSSSSQKSNSRESILPHLYDQKSHDLSTSGSNVPSPELGLQNKNNSGDSTSVNASGDDRILEDSEESRTHYRVLMSWESDYLRGSKATRGPILYAMEKLPEELKAIEGQ